MTVFTFIPVVRRTPRQLNRGSLGGIINTRSQHYPLGGTQRPFPSTQQWLIPSPEAPNAPHSSLRSRDNEGEGLVKIHGGSWDTNEDASVVEQAVRRPGDLNLERRRKGDEVMVNGLKGKVGDS